MENLNKQALTSLPPEVEGTTFGHLFIEVHNMEWFQYDGVNYLGDGSNTNGRDITKLFANIKFWGDRTRGIYLK